MTSPITKWINRFKSLGRKGSEAKRLVCLANSRKFSERCVAGKEIAGGTWIRPVGKGGKGELSLSDIRFNTGRVPTLLDIVDVPLLNPSPESFQKENHVNDDRKRWKKVGKLPYEELKGLCDPVAALWINGYHSVSGANDRIPQEIAQRECTDSLLLIHPDDLLIVVTGEYGGKVKVRGHFAFNSDLYSLTVTDAAAEKQYRRRGMGEYPIEREICLCISLTLPYDGYCYKLIAGIVEKV